MSADVALRLLSDLLWNAILIAGPLMLAALVVGVVVSILQVVTQIQDMSLTYVPKIIVAVLVLIGLGPWMLKRLGTYSTHLIQSIPFLI